MSAAEVPQAPPPIEVDREPRLGYATTDHLLREVAARIEMSVTFPRTAKGPLLTQVGDLKEAIAKADPTALAYRTAG